MSRSFAVSRSLLAGVFAVLLCIPQGGSAGALSASHVTARTAALAGQDAATPPADQKTTKQEAPPAKANAGDKAAGSNAKPASDNAKPQQATWADGFARFLRAIQELVAGILGSITWALAALVIVWLLRKQIVEVLNELVEAMRDRGVSFDVGTFVKVQVAERAPEGLDELRPVYSPSPFDLDDEQAREGASVLASLLPQLTILLSDYVARQWAKKDPANREAAERMRSHRVAFRTACEANGSTLEGLRVPLVAYARSLEATRFLEAREFGHLLAACPGVRAQVVKLQPASEDDIVVIHAAGAAFAQIGDWQTAFALLDRLAWKDQQAFYVPAAPMWISSAYHSVLVNLVDTTVTDSDEILKKLSDIIDRGETLVAAVEQQKNWDALTEVKPRKAYYLREAYKVMGDVVSIIADLVPDRETRRNYLLAGQGHLEKCVEVIAGEAPSALDHNNLADLYRQLGDRAQKIDNDRDLARSYYERAHAEMEKAFDGPRPADPTFHNTLAWLLFSEGRLDEARIALADYSSDAAGRSDDPQDLEQYFENQALAAKVAVIQSPANAYGRTAAQAILDAALRFLADSRHRLEAKTACAIEAQLVELLAFTYLETARGEDLAVEAFDRLLNLTDWKPTPLAALRARTGRANALGLSARLRRHRVSPLDAARLRTRASNDVALVLDTGLPAFAIDRTVPDERRRRNVGLWLDAVRASQLLAEEYFAGSDTKAAQDLANRVTDLLARLRAVVEVGGDPVGDGKNRKAFRRVVARRALLGGRLLVQDDPDFQKAETLRNLAATLNDVRGVSADYDCQADLELGVALLTSARLSKGDPPKDYVAAVAALERAAGRDAPSLRADAVRTLAQAYALRGTIMKRSKPSADK